MKKINKGALAMVLAGSVTFSVVTALLTDQSSKHLAEENVLTISEDQQKADVIKQPEKTVKDQTPATNVKDVQTKPSHNISVSQTDIQQNKEQFTKTTAINSANTDTTATTAPAAATRIAPSIQAPTTTANTIPAATGNNPTSETKTTTPTTTTTPATTATNHGQQVSQAVKEKTVSHQDKKETNGKKF